MYVAQALHVPEEALQRQHLDSFIAMVQLALDPTAKKECGLLMFEVLTEP